MVGFIHRHFAQTAVYWGNPQNDGYGGFVYDPPVEIKCRWEESTRVFESNDPMGTTYVSRAVVYVGQTLDFEGRLFLGTMDEVDNYGDSSGSVVHPLDVDRAYIIKRVDFIPRLGRRDGLHVVYLTK